MSKLDLKVNAELLIPAHELDEQASRSGGPGGQHVNKTSNRVTLRWNLRKSPTVNEEQRARLLDRLHSRLTRSGDLIVHVDGHRSRRRNLDEARERLIAILAEGLEVPLSRRPTRPSRSARRQRMDDKRHRSNLKRDRRIKDD
ncbi:MAG: alternative ribosome rescue aminoacyl-tRNA hydrolase ArfB [Myxococcota bacterium]|nr:alternative ribosome rescue aminoacyl-tRNA hydrolase ArfB [Myxococcota bacterium]